MCRRVLAHAARPTQLPPEIGVEIPDRVLQDPARLWVGGDREAPLEVADRVECGDRVGARHAVQRRPEWARRQARQYVGCLRLLDCVGAAGSASCDYGASVRQPFASPPLTARDCADYMGVTPAFIRKAITKGVLIDGGLTVKLEAESPLINGRHLHRIPEPKFAAFLEAIGWTHLPRHVPGAEWPQV